MKLSTIGALVFYILTTFTFAAEQNIANINAKQAGELVQSNKELIILDVRTEGEFSGAHIKGAKHIDVKQPDFKEKVAKLDRTQTYLIHCKSGGRSKRALAIMKQLGFQHLYHLDSGLNGWKKEDLPVVE